MAVYLTLLALAAPCLLPAQNVDSLESALADARGSQRIEILTSLAEAYARSNPRLAIRFGNEALALLPESGAPELTEEVRYWKGRAHFGVAEFDSAMTQARLLRESAERRGDRGGVARAANLQATTFSLQGRATEAIPLFEEALLHWQDLGDLEGSANALNNLGIAYMRLGNYDVSLDYYMKALDVWDALGDESGRIRTLTNAGNVHFDLGNTDEALSFYEEVLAYHEATGDERGQAIVLNNLGLIYHDQGRYDLALETYERGGRLAAALDDRSNLARILGNQGKTLAAMGEYETALEVEERALAIRHEIGDRRGVGITEAAIGRIHQSTGNAGPALEHFDAALEAAEEVSDTKLMRDVYQSKSEVYADRGEYASAYEAHRLFKAMHDSLFTAESQETIAELRTRYETEQKEREIEALQHERELAGLWRNILLAGLALLALVAFLIYSRYRIRLRAHRQLEAAHRQLESAHEDLATTHQELATTHEGLKTAQAQLIQSEKAASLGRLTAGIAHEMKNPLNFVNNFAAMSVDLAQELRQHLSSETPDKETIEALLQDLSGNSERIAAQGKRADEIVSNMMLHASGSTGRKEPVDLNTLVSDYVGIAWHGMKARNPDFECVIQKSFDDRLPAVLADPHELGRVLANILYNAFEATEEATDSRDADYEPELRVSTGSVDGMAEIRIWDNGIGLPEGGESQVFDPFFTTKPAGSGTGLGLSLSHDIVVGRHGGVLTAERDDDGTVFRIRLPLP